MSPPAAELNHALHERFPGNVEAILEMCAEMPDLWRHLHRQGTFGTTNISLRYAEGYIGPGPKSALIIFPETLSGRHYVSAGHWDLAHDQFALIFRHPLTSALDLVADEPRGVAGFQPQSALLKTGIFLEGQGPAPSHAARLRIRSCNITDQQLRIGDLVVQAGDKGSVRIAIDTLFHRIWKPPKMFIIASPNAIKSGQLGPLKVIDDRQIVMALTECVVTSALNDTFVLPHLNQCIVSGMPTLPD